MIGKSWENHCIIGKMGKSNCGKIMGKLWENHEKMEVEWYVVGIYPLVNVNQELIERFKIL